MGVLDAGGLPGAVRIARFGETGGQRRRANRNLHGLSAMHDHGTRLGPGSGTGGRQGGKCCCDQCEWDDGAE